MTRPEFLQRAGDNLHTHAYQGSSQELLELIDQYVDSVIGEDDYCECQRDEYESCYHSEDLDIDERNTLRDEQRERAGLNKQTKKGV